MRLCKWSVAVAIIAISYCAALSIDEEKYNAVGSRPNILLMVADDLGWADVCINQDAPCNIKTPTLDGLARSGVRIMRHYTEPWCLPSRSALLTGLAPARMAVNFVHLDTLQANLLLQEQTKHIRGLARALDSAGYFTAWIGKWHALGNPRAFGFNHCFGSLAGQVGDFFRPSLIRYPNRKLASEYSNFTELVKAGETVQGYATELEAQEAHNLIIRLNPHGKKDKRWEFPDRPFFIYLAWHAPHSPHQEVPEARHYEEMGFPAGSHANRMGQIEALDKGVKNVLGAIDKLPSQVKDNTLVVFFSDNGAPSYPSSSRTRSVNPYPTNKPLLGYKGSLYEGGIRTFAVARWAGSSGRIGAGTVVYAPMHVSDWMPTFLLLALGQENVTDILKHLDGVPVWPIVSGTCGSENHKALQKGSGMDLGCRGRPIHISSGLPVLGTLDGSWDSARLKDWKRLEGRAPRLPPLVYVERGALISPNGQCKFFLDPDDSHAAQGRDLLTNAITPSSLIMSGKYPIEKISNRPKKSSKRMRINPSTWRKWAMFKNESCTLAVDSSSFNHTSCSDTVASVQIERLMKESAVVGVNSCKQLDKLWEIRSRHLESTFDGFIRRLIY